MTIAKSTFTFLVPALVFFVICIFRVDAIRCFKCSSLEPGCANVSANDTQFMIDCPGNQTFCRKTVHTILDNDKYVRITRNCGWKYFKEEADNCYENDDDFKYEKSCQCYTDLCNSANTATTSIFVSAAAFILCLRFIYV